MKKRLIAATLMFAMFTGTAAAVSTYRKTITVEYGVGLNINGSTPILTDVNGKAVQPFVYNGTTYVPLRAVSDNLGADIVYTAENNSVNVYNDLPEILSVAHILSDTANACYLLLTTQIGGISLETNSDYYEWYAANGAMIDANWDILESLVGQNKHLGKLTGSVLTKYKNF